MDTKELAVVEYSEERVLTTEQIATAYECSTTQIKQNFNNNKEHFAEGVHYFKLEGDELRSLKNRVENFDLVGKNANVLYLWKKRGAMRHCKMLGTEKAWAVFDELEENYFTTTKSVQTSRPLRISDVAQDVVSAAKIFEEYLGLKQGIAFVHSVTLAESNYNINLDPIKKLAPPAEHNTGYMNATQLGEKLGISARTVNKWLADNGYQIKDGRDWRLTAKGKQYAEEMPYLNKGHSGYQIRWSEPVVELLIEEFVH